ncbi:MAG TPA: cell division protein ZapA [Flavipsychrobacter sp.]|nr:cell division protein ZapA [Flavipsychrobacter sp.]
MADEELIPITVWLGGRSYRLRIKPEEEETVRKAVKQADEKVMEMRTHYAGRDDQDFLAMCLLTYATDGVTGESNAFVEKELEGLSARIDKLL